MRAESGKLRGNDMARRKEEKSEWIFRCVDMGNDVFSLNEKGVKIPFGKAKPFEGTEEQAEDELIKRSLAYEVAPGTRKLLKIGKSEE